MYKVKVWKSHVQSNNTILYYTMVSIMNYKVDRHFGKWDTIFTNLISFSYIWVKISWSLLFKHYCKINSLRTFNGDPFKWLLCIHLCNQFTLLLSTIVIIMLNFVYLCKSRTVTVFVLYHTIVILYLYI